MWLFELSTSSGNGTRDAEVTYTYRCENCCAETESPAEDPIHVGCPACGSDRVSARPEVY